MNDNFFFLLNPAKGSLAPACVIRTTAKSEKSANGKINFLADEQDVDLSDYQDPILTEYPATNWHTELPEPDTFSTEWLERFEVLGDCGRTWYPKEQPAEVTTATTAATAPLSTRERFMRLSRDVRAVAVIERGIYVIDQELTEQETNHFSKLALNAGDDDKYLADFLYGVRLPELVDFNAPRFAAFIAGIARRFERGDSDANFTNIRKFCLYILGLDGGRGDPDRFNIVVALLVMGKNPVGASGSDVKKAKELVEMREEAWRGWQTSLQLVPGILQFPEALLYELTFEGMKDLKLIRDSGARRQYIRDHFAGHPLLPDYPIEDVELHGAAHGADDERAATVEATGNDGSEAVSEPQGDGAPTTTEERTGPFYYRTADGQPARANKLAKLETVLEQGCVEITKEEYQALKDAPPAPSNEGENMENPAPAAGDNNNGAVKDLGGGRFDVSAVFENSPLNDKPATEPEPAEPGVAPEFQSIAASLEQELDSKEGESLDNLSIWRKVMRTDPRYTKALQGLGFDGTSINAEYMIMRATEIFGPVGTGWGYEVTEDRMLPGAPLTEALFDDNKKFIGNRMLRDSDGSLITSQNHSIKIKFWYTIECDVRGEVEAYGATPYLYKTQKGTLICDGEAQKKSLTDAIKKALSLLGFSADVWLGLYDQPEYQAENATEFAIKNASDKAGDVTRLRNELDEKLTKVAATLESAVTANEAKKVYDSLAREVEVHRKAAEAKGDSEHAKYLSDRLRRLNQIKESRISALEGTEA